MTAAATRTQAGRRWWCERRRLGRLVADGSDAKAKGRNMEPWGRTPWFYRGRRTREGQPSTSISGPATCATASCRGTRARSPYPLTPKISTDGSPSPGEPGLSTHLGNASHKGLFLFSLAHLGPRSSLAGPTKKESANDLPSRAEAPVRTAPNRSLANGIPRPTRKNVQLTKN